MRSLLDRLDVDGCLRDAGLGGLRPGASAPCPRCRTGRVSAWAADAGFVVWMRCRSCGVSGDPIDFLGLRMGVSGGQERLRLAEQRGLLAEGVPASVEAASWLTDKTYRELCRDVFRQASGQLKGQPTPDLVQRLQRDGLWGGWAGGWRILLAGVAGVASRSQFHTWLGRVVLPKTGFRTVLVLPLEDLPGRMCGLLAVGEDGERIHTASGRREDEGGLAMLHAADGADEVLVFGSGSEALQAQWHFLSAGEPAGPITAWNERTGAGPLSSIGSRKIVFCSRGPAAPEVFRLAKSCGGRILEQQAGPGRRALTTGGRAVAEAAAAASGWAEAAARRIGDHRTPAGDVQAVLAALSPGGTERRLVVEAAPAHLRQRVERILEIRGSDLSTVVGSVTVSQRDGRWVALRAGNREEEVCDAPFPVLREIVQPDGRMWWEGEIRTRGRRLSYLDAAESICSDPSAWLRARMAAAGLGAPTVSPAWSRKLADLARLLGKPESETSAGPAKVEEDGSITLPRLQITAEGIRVRSVGWVGSSVPAGPLQPPRTRGREECDRTGIRLAMHVVLQAFLAHSLDAARRGVPGTALAVLAPAGSPAEGLFLRFAEAAGIPASASDDRTDPPSSGWPVRTAGRRWPSGLRADPRRSLWVNADQVLCEVLGASGWAVVEPPGSPEPGVPDPPIDDLTAYLAGLVRRGWPVAGSPEAFVSDVCGWRRSTLGDRDAELENLAARLLSAVRPGIRLLRAARLLWEGGHAEIVRGAGSSRTVLSRSAIMAAVSSCRLPDPDWSRCQDDGAASGVLEVNGQNELTVDTARWEKTTAGLSYRSFRISSETSV